MKTVLIKEYRNKSLIMRTSKAFHKFIVCSYYNGESWMWGNYFNNIDDALEYFNEITGLAEQRKQKERLLKALQDYEEKEFDEISYNSINEIKDIIPLAYTTVGEHEQYEIQVNFNLSKLQWEEYVNDELKRIDKRESIDDFIKELNSSSFTDIISEISSIALNMEEQEKQES